MLARKKSLKVVKSKCPVCSKGFNARSNFITCHLCDKDTHTKCIIHTFDENHFICNNCTTNVETDCDTVREDAILQEMVVSEVETIEEVAMPVVSDLKAFLIKIGFGDLSKLFEEEMIDLSMLKEMSHEDLKSIGINTFGQRHKIMKEIKEYHPPNIIENMASSNLIYEFPCKFCVKRFLSLQELNEHDSLEHGKTPTPLKRIASDSFYGGGNLYDDNFRLSVVSMTTSFLEENRAESTRLQKTQLTTSLVEDSSCQSIEDLPSRKRKFGTCNRSNTKRLKYKFYQ